VALEPVVLEWDPRQRPLPGELEFARCVGHADLDVTRESP
jgi:hypothetical protein